MKKILEALKSRSGQAGGHAIIAIGLIIVIVMLIAAVVAGTNAFSIVQNVRNMTEKAVIDTVTANAYNIYKGVREGNTANVNYTYSQDWHTRGLTNDVIGQLRTLLRLQPTIDGWAQVDSDGKTQYEISDINVTVVEISRNADNQETVNITTKVVLRLPIRFGSAEPLFTINIPLTVKSSYTPLF